MGMTASGLATRKFCPRYVENSVMSSPKRSFRSCVISLSHGVVTITAGGLGGAAWAAAAGLGAAGFGAGAAGFSGGVAASPPEGGGAAEPSGFCSSAILFPSEDHYTYHLPLGSVKRSEVGKWGGRPRPRATRWPRSSQGVSNAAGDSHRAR